MKLLNQQLIKDSNLKRVYNFVYQNPGISRAALAKQTSLSKTTVSALVDELIEQGYLQDLGVSDDTTVPGRKPNALKPLAGSYYTIVLLWGEYYIEAHLTDITGSSTPFIRREARDPWSYISTSRECVDTIISRNGLKKWQILGICIVVPAMIDMEAEKIYSTSLHFMKYENFGFVEELQKAFPDFKTLLLNDTACQAYAEKTCTGLKEPDFAFINFDRGIGATLFIHNEMLGHASASYTQFGHYSVCPDGPLCECGNRGCLELVISEEALSQQYREEKGSSKGRYPITYKDLGYAAAIGDETAKKVLERAAKTFAHALGNLICLVHPKLIILGGKGRDLGDYFLEETVRQLGQTGFRHMVETVSLRYSLLDGGACFVGAMKYFFDTHFSFGDTSDTGFYLG